MAIHRFTCNKCKIYIEDGTTKGVHKCPKCKSDMALDCKVAIHGNYRTPVHSDSLAVHPSQVAEHEMLYPNVKLDKQCRPVFENFTQHEKYLKETGFEKLPQKIRRAGAKRIA